MLNPHILLAGQRTCIVVHVNTWSFIAFVCFLSQISKTEFDSASQKSEIQKEVFVHHISFKFLFVLLLA